MTEGLICCGDSCAQSIKFDVTRRVNGLAIDQAWAILRQVLVPDGALRFVLCALVRAFPSWVLAAVAC